MPMGGTTSDGVVDEGFHMFGRSRHGDGPLAVGTWFTTPTTCRSRVWAAAVEAEPSNEPTRTTLPT